jgi:hypothetical protein
MEVLDAKVEWNEEYMNHPKLQVLVSNIPSTESMTFESAMNGQIWYGEHNGYVKFFSGSPDENRSGYSGRSFKLNTPDGEVVLTGPYSSRAGVMNKNGFGPCVDVSITTDSQVLEKGYTFSAGSITLEKARNAIENVEEATGLRKKGGSEPIWIPER